LQGFSHEFMVRVIRSPTPREKKAKMKMME